MPSRASHGSMLQEQTWLAADVGDPDDLCFDLAREARNCRELLLGVRRQQPATNGCRVRLTCTYPLLTSVVGCQRQATNGSRNGPIWSDTNLTGLVPRLTYDAIGHNAKASSDNRIIQGLTVMHGRAPLWMQARYSTKNTRRLGNEETASPFRQAECLCAHDFGFLLLGESPAMQDV